MNANPRWFEGDWWRLEFRENGEHKLKLFSDFNEGTVTVGLTDQQAAMLAAHALADDFKRYRGGPTNE